MAYRLKLRQSIEKGVRRIGVEQIDHAVGRLRGKPEDRPTSVHEMRKSMKRVRALLRLVRPSLGEVVFKRENARFREIAALLASARDRHVLAETLIKLAASLARGDARTMAAIRRAELALVATGDDAVVSGEAIQRAVSELESAREEFKNLRVNGRGFAVALGGLRLTYSNAREAFAAAYRDPCDEAFHELRKSVQQHWRHMLLIRRCWPEAIAVRANAARDMSDALGDDHDLTMLIGFVSGLPASAIKRAEARLVVEAARARQEQLRAKARRLGELLLAERPRAFCRRAATYWETAKSRPPVKKPKIAVVDAPAHVFEIGTHQATATQRQQAAPRHRSRR